QWKADKFNGQGTLTMTDGSHYTGHFVDGMEDGKGVLTDKDGTRYDGTFKQGQRNGAFVETDKNGTVIRRSSYRMGRLEP
ncbi:MAG: phosphatidylinositol-4-phosphate 5-kinase, partial [Prevotellaceae bacterium]|nr:phosphatidylinositol-4-phosphate 5-kinase [Prevotellaceae bacterium]